MSNTRHATPGSPLRQNRYASSPALENGLLANLVAKRCTTLDDPRDRELVWALQYISHQAGGLKALAAALVAKFGDQFGTDGMVRVGKHAGQTYSADEVRAICAFLPYQLRLKFPLRGETRDEVSEGNRFGLATAADDARRLRKLALEASFDSDWEAEQFRKGREAEQLRERQNAMSHPNSYPVDHFLALCQKEALDPTSTEDDEALDPWLQDLCLDPACGIRSAPWYCGRLPEILRAYLACWTEERAASQPGFAHTTLSKAVWQEIRDAHEMGNTVLLHNSTGNGKSHAAKAYCEAHPGHARYVNTPATNDETGFLRAIAEALGTGAGLSFKAIQMRERILPTLRGGHIVLVLDSAQWLFPVSDYRYALPNRINWVLSALSEQGVSVVMIADTKLFDTLGLVEARTGWNRNKFVNQVAVVALPGALEKEDVQSVAVALLPDGDRAAQHKLADFMIVAQGYLHAGQPTAQRARRIATSHKRDRITLADMNEAIETRMLPAFNSMNAALKRADAAAARCKAKVRNWRPDTEAQITAKGKRRNQIVTSCDVEQTPQGRPAKALQDSGSKAAEEQFHHRGASPRVGTQPGRGVIPADLATV